eukprot:TRINITY_DN333_c0_g1_i1.p1 TRINITY_DN333_c0_g1~~TRINITY_DN333_c0_g1_i1.p1  ORF type:complete len:397 (-),score=52.41 TRINITY_DN333_c0_g1_i1:333-1523(-)
MAVAFRASTPHSPHPLSYAPKPKPTLKVKTQLKPPSIPSKTSAAISVLALFSTPSEAQAFGLSREQILTSITKVEDTIDQIQYVGSTFLDFSRGVLQILAENLKPGVDVALPIIRKVGDEALKIAYPVISNASKQAQEALQSAGVDTQPVITAAKTVAGAAQQTTKVIEQAKPIASATVETLSSTDPSVVVLTAGTLFLAYLVVPPLWSVVSYNLRGYKGNLSPAQALDLISTKSHLMIDVRSEKDKSKTGVPRLPSSAKSKLISIPLEELPSKIKGLVRNVKKVEAEIAALKISYLKRVNKGSNIVIMDSYSDTAKIVAKALTSLGFKNCWIMAGGFSGSRGWLQSRLGTDSYNVSLAEVVSPLRIIRPAVKRFGTTGSTALQATRKFLPGGGDD